MYFYSHDMVKYFMQSEITKKKEQKKIQSTKLYAKV